MRSRWFALGTMACVAWPSAVWACSPITEARYDLVSFAPADGAEDVPTNGVLRFRFACSDSPEPTICAYGAYRLQVRLTAEGSDLPVTGQIVHFDQDDLFVPSEPLAPNTTYLVNAEIPVQREEIAGDGVRTASFSFRTGEMHSPGISESEPSASRFEAYAAPVGECEYSGRVVGQEALDVTSDRICAEESCALIDGTEPVARVALTTGRVTGPFDADGYLWIFEVTKPGSPQSIYRAERRHLAQDEVATFTWDLLPKYDEVYEGACASLRVMDIAGQVFEAQQTCFELVEARQGVLEDPSDEDFDGHPSEPEDAAHEEPVKHASSCSTTAAADPFGALSVVIASIALVRRRRQTT